MKQELDTHVFHQRDPLDEMEKGRSFEMLPDEVYLPVHDTRGWIKCNIIVNEDLYSLYMERNYRLLLKAKKLDDVFYISTCEVFDAEDVIPHQRVSAKLIKSTTKFKDAYTLCTTHCRYCDHGLGLYTCGHSAAPREIQGLITMTEWPHLDTIIRKHVGKCATVTIPIVSNETRVVWCPRAFRVFGYNTPDIRPLLSEVHSPIAFSQSCKNLGPIWNPHLNCLEMQFDGDGDRMTSSSRYNMVLYAEESLLTKSDLNELFCEDSIFQFGEVTPHDFIMDFRHPLSALQAFAIALSNLDTHIKYG